MAARDAAQKSAREQARAQGVELAGADLEVPLPDGPGAPPGAGYRAALYPYEPGAGLVAGLGAGIVQPAAGRFAALGQNIVNAIMPVPIPIAGPVPAGPVLPGAQFGIPRM